MKSAFKSLAAGAPVQKAGLPFEMHLYSRSLNRLIAVQEGGFTTSV